jgi:spore coat polysaccharide biosynthesis protein SpsF
MQTALIQARASSVRLPGKVLREVAGKPLLQYLVERLRHAASLDRLVLATSSDVSDDAVAALGKRLGLEVIRGPLDDVLGRFLLAARQYALASLVRVNGDSPLLDPALVDRAVALYEAGGADLVTNTFPRSFPKGQSVEVMSCAALERAAASQDPQDREHVTRYLYRHPEQFRIANFAREPNAGDLQLSVDTADDLRVFERLIARLDRPHWEVGVEELIALLPGLAPG